MSGNKRFRIVSGTFRRADDTIAGEGEILELDDHTASVHAAQLQAIDDDVRLTGPLIGTRPVDEADPS